MGSPVPPAARPAMEEEEEAIGYLDKVLEDEDDSEPGTPTSPVSPFSPGEKVGSGGTLLPCWAVGVGTRGILLVLVMPRCWNSSRGDVVGAGGGHSWGQREHHCGPTTPPGLPAARGTGQGCARLQVWRAQSGVTTQLSFQGRVEPHMLWGGSCVAQQSQHWMLRKGFVLHSALLLGHQKLLNSPKTELGGGPGETPVLAGAAQHPSHAHPARVPGCCKMALGLLFLGSPAWGSH